MPLVYVAGPLSRGNAKVNAEFAILAGDVLLRNGIIPYIPHLTYYWNQITPHTWEEWLNLDEEWLKLCDYILRLPGPSSGADRECALAKQCGKPVFDNLVDLFDYIRGIAVETIDRKKQ